MSKECQCSQNVSLLQWKDGNSWRQQQARPKDLRACDANGLPKLISTESQVCIILASANKIRDCEPCRRAFIEAFCMPQTWWSDCCRSSNGYFGTETSGTGTALGINTWVFFEVKQVRDADKYGWDKINVFTRWLPATKQVVILVFDAPRSKDERIPLPLLSPDPAYLGDPYWVYTRLLEEVAHLQDGAVWGMRNHVRTIEKSRLPEKEPEPNYSYLHDLARHAIHVSETLDVASQTIGHIQRQHESSMELYDDKAASKNIHSRLQFFESIISNLKHRSSSNKERLVNEMQLAFNVVAQYDAGVSVEIGRVTQIESSAMRTIAFVTMAFLPPTFICAIFSMSFFNYSTQDGWSYSKEFWLYWAFALPTTLITFVWWYFWQKRFQSAKVSGYK